MISVSEELQLHILRLIHYEMFLLPRQPSPEVFQEQVLTILLNTAKVADIVNLDFDDEPSLVEERQHRVSMSKNRMSPRVRLAMVRHFLVVHDGIRSGYCL